MPSNSPEANLNGQNPIEKFKAAFAQTGYNGQKLLHFNNAGVAPTIEPAYETIKLWNERLYRDGCHVIVEAEEACDGTRKSLAQLINAKPSEIGFFQNTAGAISQVAFGLNLKPGDEIVIFDQEYPSNFHPWREAAERSRAVVKLAKSPTDTYAANVEAIIEATTSRTRVIAFSWVQFRTGAIADLERLTDFARSKNIFTCADVIQGVGLLPFDFHASKLDAVCGGSHKWLASAPSVGYLALREEHIREMKPILVGALTFGTPNDIPSLNSKMKTDASKFESGSKLVMNLLGFGAGLGFINEIGIANIAQEIEWLSKKLAHGLRERGYLVHSPHGMHHRGSIVNFTPGKDARYKSLDDVTKQLTNLKATFALRAPGVRLSPHAFNTTDEIEQILNAL